MEGAKFGAMLGGMSGGESPVSMPLSEIVFLFGHSILAGLLLASATYIISKKFNGNEAESNTGILLGASNIMFICVGLTGIMILVNNNIVRAFAIVAAIALVRFRIKLSENNVNASLLFGVMSGMAFGLKELTLGWSVIAVFFTLLVLVMSAVAISEAISKKKSLLDKRVVRKLTKPQKMRQSYKTTPSLKVLPLVNNTPGSRARSADL